MPPADEPAGQPAAQPIALFPLRTVLFPGGPLPLRIFEPRYVDMVRRCMRENAAFGVVLIRAGAEAGAVASTAAIGTSARIVDFSQLADGLLGITCAGERRFRVLRRWQQPDGLNEGEIHWLAETAAAPLPAEYAHLAQLLRKVLPECGERYDFVERNFTDAAWVGRRLAEMLPLTLAEKQRCLEIDDPLALLARLAPRTAANGSQDGAAGD